MFLSPRRHRRKSAFTMMELLVVITIIAILSTLGFSLFGFFKRRAQGSVCSLSLKQLGAATSIYLSENNGGFPPYKQVTPNGTLWYFGLETASNGQEGDRVLDKTQGPLYPYIMTVGNVEICPSFNYTSALWKPKFKGASWGYGYNWILGGTIGGVPLNVSAIGNAGQIILFGDCAQVNTFEAPASPSHPMLEEFYILNDTYQTVHCRHGNRANFVFVDGHVESFPLYPGTQDTRIASEVIGRVTPAGSMMYLK